MTVDEERQKLIDNGFILYDYGSLIPTPYKVVFDKEDEGKLMIEKGEYGIAKLIDGVYNIYHIDYIYRHNII